MGVTLITLGIVAVRDSKTGAVVEYNLSRCTVLLVEDNQFVRNTLEDLLRHFKFARVTTAENGEEAIDYLKTMKAAGNPGPGRRRVLSLRFLGDDMVHAPRTWATSPPFPGLEAELPAGALMNHALFPVVWPPRGADQSPSDPK